VTLERIRGAGASGSAGVAGRLLGSFAVSDPSDVVGATSQAAGAGGLISCTMQNNAVASATPNLGFSLSISSVALIGAGLRESDMVDLLSAVAVYAGDDDPTTADVTLWAGLADAPIGSETTGFGATLTASGTDWQAGHLVFPSAGAWTRVAGGAANANTRGARALARPINNTTQRTVGAAALDSTGAEIAGAPGSAPANSAVGNDLDTFFLGVGWATGAGGTNGAVVRIYGFELLLRMLDLVGVGRPAA
jgi:hypothetical protein